ncbi:putative F-box protein At1g65770 [Rhododendron vialii]|uniref:putative F-box protein At1g65770 n=1 Tax=Rhododendron vialii TaxID=182163 RepID=UPI0026602A11|nr:putative F-box protein At1g65770 [Rhododendron vialii]
MGNWAELPEDILVLIAKRITLFEDFLFFSGVCRSWRSVAVNDNFKESDQIPWLMLSEKDKPDERQFVSMRKGGVIRTINLPEARGKRCLETLGWLVTTSEDSDINLLHPFTRVQINVSHISTSEYYHPRRNKHLRFINKAILSSRPEEGKDYVLMVIYAGGDTGGGFLAFWRSRDKSWIAVNIVWFYDINFYNGLCYGVRGTVSTEILAFDVWGPNPTVALVVGYGPSHVYFEGFKKPHIVESAGVVLIVHRIFGQVSPSTFSEDDPYIFETCRFTVFEFDSSEKGKGVEKTSLGNSALFLGDNASVSVDTSRFPGIKANCIYYTDSFKRGGNYMGIYNMEDGSLSPCYEGDPSSLICPPMWVNPSLH